MQTASKYRVKVGMPGEAFEREHVWEEEKVSKRTKVGKHRAYYG